MARVSAVKELPELALRLSDADGAESMRVVKGVPIDQPSRLGLGGSNSLLTSRGILGGGLRPQADCDQQQFEVYLIDGDLPLMILSATVRSLALVS
jgi:hypothetical protein